MTETIRDRLLARVGGAHLAAAAAVVLIAAIPQEPVTSGALIGFMLGVVREVTEGGDVTSDGSLLDVLFWMLGGGFAGWLLT